MSSRKCGYCREIGHISNVCPIRNGQLEDYSRHIVNEKRALHHLVMNSGLGIGSILRFKDYRDIEHICTIRSHETLMTGNVFVDSRDMRYMKSVRLDFASYSGLRHARAEESRFNHHSDRSWFYIVANPLDSLSKNMYISVGLESYDGRRHVSFQRSDLELLAPSNDTDIPAERYRDGYYLPVRLAKNRNQRWTIPQLDK